MAELNFLQPTFQYDHKSKFEKLGLSFEILQSSISAGISEYMSASSLAPLNAGGSKASFAIIENIREQLLQNSLGWSMVNKHGQCLTNNADENLSIVVTSGDKDTGLADGYPCTKNGKGTETKNQVLRNIGKTLNLFDEPQITNDCADIDSKKVDTHELWLLLYYFDHQKKEVRFELSLPIGYKEVGRYGKVKVTDWGTRLFFTPVSFEDYLITKNITAFSDDIDFVVTSKE
tara:strand:+ start:6686 stop:7381 length:696 start_codon:yes stop_codon:yes gene_type:complete